ncbi:MAG: PolC-type DNA polymerase III, partial [Lachnospiraceae bacterium]|nr:PolC-type DNA polymerase III [Lachnospiraceae bacterium]
MRKNLLEVFPGLPTAKLVTMDLLQTTEVERLAYSEDRRTVNAFLVFHRLVDKPVILSLEKALNEQFFNGGDTGLRIRESYELSDYSLSDIVSLYRDSAVMDLIREYPAFSSILRRSHWEVRPDGRLGIQFSGNGFAKNYAKDWAGYIEKRFLQRFGIQVSPVMEITEKTAREETEAACSEPWEDAPQSPQDAPQSVSTELPFSSPAMSSGPENTSSQASFGLKDARRSRKQDGKVTRTPKNDSSGRPVRAYKTDDPDVLYGRPFKDASQKLSSYLSDEEGPMVVLGEILSVETKPTKSGERTIFIFTLTDYSDTIRVKFFVRQEFLEEVKAAIYPGRTVRVKGDAEIDRYDHELMIQHIYGIMRYDLPLMEQRRDDAAEKRIELHAHTKYSDNDSVLDAEAFIKRAAFYGHPAVAVTDHGNVQAFPTVLKTAKALKQKGTPIKILYGMEGYLVDDTQAVAVNPTDACLTGPLVVFDLETTGFSSDKNRIIEIGAVRIEDGHITDRFSSFINPGEKISYRIESLTSITNEDLRNAPPIEEVLPKFMAFADGCFFVGHNAEFDVSFLIRNLRRVMPGMPTDFPWADTLGISRFLLPKLSRYRLDAVAKELHVSLLKHHRAVDDAECTAEIYLKLLPRLESRGILTLRDLAEKCRPDENTIKKLNTYHVTIFVKNEAGRIALYRLVSDSNLKYYYRRPRIPKSALQEVRENLIIGSACCYGELFDAVLRGVPDEEIARIVSFYDYLEIQPLGNNAFLKKEEDYDYIRTDEDLKDLNRTIVSLGEQFKKPVVATGDVHFMDPQDAIYRTFLQDSEDFKDADDQAPLYFRTTEEMLSEFDYLGSDKAHEVVIENPKKIADQIEEISPIDAKKSPPVIEGSDQDLREHAFMVARELYGDPLPRQVEERLERELTAIISNGYAVMYSIAHKLIKKSMSDGYLVGSRGSVGSSLAATMYEITEVNPLPPHYRCPKCRYSEFESEECIRYRNNTGWDMPDKLCPKCGTKLIKDGCNIPFETFMGFKGDKEPDIDLNFSGEYQAKAHAYTEVIFGKGQTFKAGTVQAIQDKIGSAIVYKYFQKKGIQKRNAEIDRLGMPLLGVKRSTGQHPG